MSSELSEVIIARDAPPIDAQSQRRVLIARHRISATRCELICELDCKYCADFFDPPLWKRVAPHIAALACSLEFDPAPQKSAQHGVDQTLRWCGMQRCTGRTA